MSLNEIIFNRNKGGLGTPLLTKDHISGLIYYNDVLPAGFSTTDRIKRILSLEQAEDLGIIEGSADHSKEWYHIREYFEKNPKGDIFVGIFAVPAAPATNAFPEIETIQVFADGEIRQLGVYLPQTDLTAALVNSIQAQVTSLKGLHML